MFVIFVLIWSKKLIHLMLNLVSVTQRTLFHHYRDKARYCLWNSRYLYSESYETHAYVLCANCVVLKFEACGVYVCSNHLALNC
jgi:hypothetical protein